MLADETLQVRRVGDFFNRSGINIDVLPTKDGKIGLADGAVHGVGNQKLFGCCSSRICQF